MKWPSRARRGGYSLWAFGCPPAHLKRVGAGPMGCRSEQEPSGDPWALKHNAPPGAQLVLGVRKK